MPVVERANGQLRVQVPATYRVADQAPAEGTRPGAGRARAGRERPTGPIPLPAAAPGGEDDEFDELAAVLQRQELELVDRMALEPAPPEAAPGRRGPSTGRRPARQTVRLTLEVDAAEDGVVLVEQDGVYAWVLPDAGASAEPPAPAPRRGRRPPPARRELRFTIEVRATDRQRSRRETRGFLRDLVVGAVRAYVFKFAARVVAGKAITFLERDVARGLVVMDAADPRVWRRVDDLAALRLPKDRPARILLFVHGTFSSTMGSFGSLGAYPWGRSLLAGAARRYDAVIGFDHPTLSVDPLENATDLLRRLRARGQAPAPTFDVVAYSRGGLVARSLVEQLLPAAGWDATVDRIVFVAVTNGGTRLAEPDNWRELVDLYTNLVMATRRVVGLVPDVNVQLLAEITGGLVEGLGAFVKYLVTHAISEGGVPGLAAMEPDGSFVTTLNATQPGQPVAAATAWYAVVSDFQGRIRNGDHEPTELPRRLVLALADGLIDRLIGAANDLVVDTASMTAADPAVGGFIKDALDFGVNPHVFHTSYFTRPETCAAIGRWLELPDVTPDEAATRPRRRRRARVEVVAPGAVVGPTIPVMVDDDITVVAVNDLVGSVISDISARPSNYVVVRRPEWQGSGYVYAYRHRELMGELEGHQPSLPLGTALEFHEGGASPQRSISEVSPTSRQSGGGAASLALGWATGTRETGQAGTGPTGPAATNGRSVVFDGDQPIGVIPEPLPLPSAGDLAGAAVRPPPSRPGGRQPRPKASRSRRYAAAPRMAAGEVAESLDLVQLPQAAPQVAHFRAAMPEQTTVGALATVTVAVSPDALATVMEGLVATGRAAFSMERPILVQVIPKANVKVDGEDRAEVQVPLPAGGIELYFDVRPTYAGEGEVQVVARQGPVPLVTLRLKPRIAPSSATVTAVGQATADCAVDLGAVQDEPGDLHWLRIEETTQGGATVYHYDLQAEDLEVLGEWSSEPLKGDHQAYVRNLYKEIEDRWVSTDGDTEAFEAELRAFGGDLLDRLIPEELQRALWKHRGELKVLVLSSEPFIPWELVHLKARHKGVLPRDTLFLGQLGVVRWLHDTWPRRKLRVRRGRARYIIPRYPHPDWALPEAEAEQQFLEERFGAKAVDPDQNAVRKLLTRRGAFDLLHFAGHGFAESDDIANAQVMLTGRVEDGKYIPTYLNATTVRQHGQLRDRQGNGPLVVFNACQTGRLGHQLTSLGGFAKAFLSVGAAAFVSSLWSVGDVPARTFTESLYAALLDGATVSEATTQAREKARVAGDATWLAYVIYAHPRARLTVEQ